MPLFAPRARSTARPHLDIEDALDALDAGSVEEEGDFVDINNYEHKATVS